LIWNRLRYLRDPETGKRVSRLNPSSEWVVTEVPDLRIVDDALWSRVKARQEEVRSRTARADNKHGNRLLEARRPKYLFSGMTRCGVCGGGIHVYTGNRLACYASRARGTCSNRLTIRREEVEARVLGAVRDKLLNRELFDEFCREFTREMNRLQGEERARQGAVRQDLVAVTRQIAKLIEAIKDGVPGLSIKDELMRLEDRKTNLERSIEQDPDTRPLLHAGMADLYRQKVAALCESLTCEEARPQASEALRGLLDEIVLEPSGSELGIEVRGNLASLLRFAQNAKRSRPSESDELERTVSLVAGAGFEPATFGL
jgi:site-specific DNA recombinase